MLRKRKTTTYGLHCSTIPSRLIQSEDPTDYGENGKQETVSDILRAVNGGILSLNQDIQPDVTL
jgi:hypothetical protein